MKEQESGLFFVQIKEPSLLKREMLEILKKIIELMQSMENSKHIRQEKVEKIQKLRTLLRDADKLFGSLKTKLPQTNLRAAAVEKHIKVGHKKSKHAEEAIPKKEATELEKLQSELNAIESKLKSLT